MASARLLEKALYPLIVFIQTTPQIAIAPLLIVWFGYGALPKVMLAAMLTFFPVLVDSSTGFKSIDPRIFYVTRSMGASRWQTFRRVQLPAALPLIVSGCKISLLISVTVVIVVEFLSSNEGLGYVAVRALSNQDLSLMFAAIFTAIGIGLAFSYLVDLGEWLLMPWVRVGTERPLSRQSRETSNRGRSTMPIGISRRKLAVLSAVGLAAGLAWGSPRPRPPTI